MCGIVGYVGKGNVKQVILQGLETLEYRGYDSAGIALVADGEIFVEKKKGRLQNLSEALMEVNIPATLGIGHTRWATHGAPSDVNSHPHCSMDNSVVVVHNGIIENYLDLKKELEVLGYKFISDTDTEVVAHLVQYYYEGDILETVFKVLGRIEGSYALGILHKNHPDELICARKDAPLVIGLGKNENLIASDIPALLKYTREVYFLENGDVARIKSDSVEIFDIEKNPISRELNHIEWTLEQATKAGYPHFMIKEILEQPTSINETLHRRLKDGKADFSDVLSKSEIEKINKIVIVACGTAYNAGLQGQYALHKIAKLNSEVDIASEFRYSDPFIDDKTLAIFVSQSGETLDTLAALREAKERGATTLAITNVIGSSISREADKVVYTMAGPEIAVASTKAYTTQVVMFYLFSLYLAEQRGVITQEEYSRIMSELISIPEKINFDLKRLEKVKEIASFLKDKTNGFYIGRGLDYRVALEGSLKIKEVSYIHTEAFPSGELKHGTIALIEEGTPVVVLATQRDLMDKSISNIKELKARGAHVIAIGHETSENLKLVADDFIPISESDDLVSGILSVIPVQALAYYTSVAKGIDVDKPKNLAKSVTVE